MSGAPRRSWPGSAISSLISSLQKVPEGAFEASEDVEAGGVAIVGVDIGASGVAFGVGVNL
jgi:hypothetical protein